MNSSSRVGPAVLAALLTSACGGSDGGAGRSSNGIDSDAAAEVALEFYEALASGDEEEACEHLSSLQEERMASSEANLASQEGRDPEGCGAGLEYNFLPGSITQPEIAEATENGEAVEVYLTREEEFGLRAQVVLEDGEWRVDEYGTATGPISVAPICAEKADDATDLPEPNPVWLSDFQRGYYADFSDDRVITSGGAYTQVLVDELEACGMDEEVFEQLVESVATAAPSTLVAPDSYPFSSFGSEQVFVCQLANAAALTYEVTSCGRVEPED